jgi:integrase
VNNIKYAVEGTEFDSFTYTLPVVGVDGNGGAFIKHHQNKYLHTHIKKITFLNLVGRNAEGQIVSYDTMDYVNNFLMYRHVGIGLEESAQQSKGLIHFFSFLIDLQEKWDLEISERQAGFGMDADELLAEGLMLPRPRWDWMPVRKQDRVTYQYHRALKNMLEGKESPLQLARSTAKAYMSAVVQFYKFHIARGMDFGSEPFMHEIVNISYQASGISMKPYITKAVHTTDLRLKVTSKSHRNHGGAFPTSRRDLRPLTNQQWKEVEKILTDTRKVLKNVKGEMRLVSLAEEYCLFFLIGRFTGLRKEEVASLHSGQVVKPEQVEVVVDDDPQDAKTTFKKACLRLGVGDAYGSFTKTNGGGNKSRKTIIPPGVMQLMHEYMRSARYKKRLAKFKELCRSKHNSGDIAFFESEDGVDESKDYLFLSATGKPFFLKLNELNNRWNEIRRTVKEIIGTEFDGAIHNLRPTFAVGVFRSLLRKNMPHDKALALVSDLLGHESLSTTQLYLQIAIDEPTGDEIWEDVLDFVGIFDGLDESQEDPDGEEL